MSGPRNPFLILCIVDELMLQAMKVGSSNVTCWYKRRKILLGLFLLSTDAAFILMMNHG